METLGFCTAGLAETAKWVHQPAIRHFFQFGKGPIRFQICISDFFEDLVSVVDDTC